MKFFKNKEVLVIGGLGYVGTSLVPSLIKDGYTVTILDSMIFGNNLELQESKNLKIIKGDFRDLELINTLTKERPIVIHLAALSNDSSSEIDEKYTREINYFGTMKLIDQCIQNQVPHFIFASSASVYGIQDGNVTEDTLPNPITLYGELKLKIEKYLFSQESMNFTVVRPATLCGYSNRLRLDLSVNILTYSGFFDKKIKVFGGSQYRPNLNIQDMVRFYMLLLKMPLSLINRQIYNVSYCNKSILELAELTQSQLNNHSEIEIVPTTDLRSYVLSSEKSTRELGFQCKYTIEDAIGTLINCFEKETKKHLSSDLFRNVARIKNLLNEVKNDKLC